MCWRSRSMRSTSRSPGEIERLTDPAYDNAANMDGAGRTLFVARSNPTQPPQSLYRRRARASGWRGSRRTRSTATIPTRPTSPSHRAPEFGTISRRGRRAAALEDGHAADGAGQALSGVLPALRRPARAGGDARAGATPAIQAIVDKGYIWFALDNRGSTNRGVAFERPIYRAMGGPEVRDQKAGRRVPQRPAVRRSRQDRHLWLVLRRLHDAQDAARPIPGSMPRASAVRR